MRLRHGGMVGIGLQALGALLFFGASCGEPLAEQEVAAGLREGAPLATAGCAFTDQDAEACVPSATTEAGPVTRTVGYRSAVYTQRNNWVHDCGRGYAYTAAGTDHLSEDCDGLYRPDRTLRGTATFTFSGVVAATYDVIVAARHSMNRDAGGARFTVNGTAFTVNQRVGDGIVKTTLLRSALAGEVKVMLDSSRGGGSDSIQSVTLRPVP